jgi:Icc-related predicted phosphoesterase
MKIAAVSDMHGMLTKEMVPPADVLVIAGDYCPNFRGGETHDARQQLEWIKDHFNPLLRSLNISKRIVCAGNHDWTHYVDETKNKARRAIDATYLENDLTVIDGVKFYASPYQPWFYDWAFNFERRDPELGYPQAREIWSRIPDGTQVLITHGPPANILDRCPDGSQVGCPILRERILQIKPKLHLFGHIHGSYGTEEHDGVRFGNVSLCDEGYRPVQPIQVFEV